jgi:hypothetical protein
MFLQKADSTLSRPVETLKAAHLSDLPLLKTPPGHESERHTQAAKVISF